MAQLISHGGDKFGSTAKIACASRKEEACSTTFQICQFLSDGPSNSGLAGSSNGILPKKKTLSLAYILFLELIKKINSSVRYAMRYALALP